MLCSRRYTPRTSCLALPTPSPSPISSTSLFFCLFFSHAHYRCHHSATCSLCLVSCTITSIHTCLQPPPPPLPHDRSRYASDSHDIIVSRATTLLILVPTISCALDALVRYRPAPRTRTRLARIDPRRTLLFRRPYRLLSQSSLGRDGIRLPPSPSPAPPT